MKISYVVTFDQSERETVTPEELEKVRRQLEHTVREKTAPAWHVTVTQLVGLPPHPFPTP